MLKEDFVHHASKHGATYIYSADAFGFAEIGIEVEVLLILDTPEGYSSLRFEGEAEITELRDFLNKVLEN